MSDERETIQRNPESVAAWKRECAFLREQLVALAEQNKLLRGFAHERHDALLDQFVTAMPDLASPILNRIRADGMRMAAEIADMFSDKHSMNFAGNAAEAIRARAAELEKTNG